MNLAEAKRRMDRRYKKKETVEDLAFKKELQDKIEGEWVWCLHCERTYNKKDMRWDERSGLYLCAYKDCDGDAFGDAWSYLSLMKAHPNWSDVPEHGKVYGMY
jgi:hypothetical protein